MFEAVPEGGDIAPCKPFPPSPSRRATFPKPWSWPLPPSSLPLFSWLLRTWMKTPTQPSWHAAPTSLSPIPSTIRLWSYWWQPKRYLFCQQNRTNITSCRCSHVLCFVFFFLCVHDWSTIKRWSCASPRTWPSQRAWRREWPSRIPKICLNRPGRSCWRASPTAACVRATITWPPRNTPRRETKPR